MHYVAPISKAELIGLFPFQYYILNELQLFRTMMYPTVEVPYSYPGQLNSIHTMNLLYIKVLPLIIISCSMLAV